MTLTDYRNSSFHSMTERNVCSRLSAQWRHLVPSSRNVSHVVGFIARVEREFGFGRWWIGVVHERIGWRVAGRSAIFVVHTLTNGTHTLRCVLTCHSGSGLSRFPNRSRYFRNSFDCFDNYIHPAPSRTCCNYTHAHTDTRIHTCTHEWKHTRVVAVFFFLLWETCVFLLLLYVCVCVCVSVRACVWVWVRACMSACVCVCGKKERREK